MKKNIFSSLRALGDPSMGRALLKKLETLLGRYGQPLRFMEVCGTHTVSIFRSGLRSLLPPGLTHISGPGCPVCVTHDSEITACLHLAKKTGICLASFGDLLRVPGPDGLSLKDARALGAWVEVIYSPQDAMALARKYRQAQVVFLGAGFETTAPAVAACLRLAKREKLENFYVLSLHKLVPPALRALLHDGDAGTVDAFILPGHVSSILGMEPYRFIAEEFLRPGVITGFEPADIIQALIMTLQTLLENRPAILNQYSRAVSPQGNPKAREIMLEVFRPQNALWRGLGELPASGLTPREDYADFDAWRVFGLEPCETAPPAGCRCGDVLKGKINPPECVLFARACTPAKPVGPCMVSSEGSCAAWYR
ncbi:MAG: hydrogenase formation protein HypD, partial [Deltaproteobacteria bacterium]|nr:hydrogenase formation protein HypD [Deltaproteobacteria bacterium]